MPVRPAPRRGVVLLLALVAATSLLPARSPAAEPAPIPPPDFDALWNYDDPAATEARFRELLASTKNPSPEWRLQLLTQIARSRGLQRDFSGAHKLLDEAERGLRKAGGVDALPRVQVRVLLERGRTLRSSGKPAEARPIFEQAWDLASARAFDHLAVDAAHMVALVAAPSEVETWHQQALALAEASSDPRARRWRGSLLNNMGWDRFERGQFAEALSLFERARQARVEQGEPEPLRAARWCVARAKRALGRAEEALIEQQALLADCGEAASRDGYVHEEIGESLLALGRVDEARPSLLRAAELLGKDAWLVRSEPARIERLRRIGSGGPAGVSALAWMAGDWSGLQDGGLRSEERWSAPAGGLMLGGGRMLKDGKAVDWEWLRIEEDEGGVPDYMASPQGRAPATPFRLVEIGPGRAVFANPEHDFPRRIEYLRDGDGMTVRVSGAGGDGDSAAERSFELRWNRVGP